VRSPTSSPRSGRSGCPVVGFNLCYDLTLLDRELRRHGRPPLEPGYVIDAFVLDKHVSYRRGPRKLVDQCQHYGVRIDGAHDAAADALAAARVAWRIAQRYPTVSGKTLPELHDAQAVGRRAGRLLPRLPDQAGEDAGPAARRVAHARLHQPHDRTDRGMTTTDLATVNLNPADLHGQMELAKVLGMSALLPQALRGKPADVLVTVMYGREMGLTPMQSIQGIYVVNGRPPAPGSCCSPRSGRPGTGEDRGHHQGRPGHHHPQRRPGEPAHRGVHLGRRRAGEAHRPRTPGSPGRRRCSPGARCPTA
jgi:hypothetical protein